MRVGVQTQRGRVMGHEGYLRDLPIVNISVDDTTLGNDCSSRPSLDTVPRKWSRTAPAELLCRSLAPNP